MFTVYQWARPRDLAHYEDFVHYHETFGARVEGLTTTPFSDRALDRGLSGVLVSCMRHSSPAALSNRAAGTLDLASTGPVSSSVMDGIISRSEKVLDDVRAVDDVRRRLVYRLELWAQRRDRVQSGVLGYETAPDVTGLLHPPEEGGWDHYTIPRSMREVEPEVLLQLQQEERSLETAPTWQYRSEVPQ